MKSFLKGFVYAGAGVFRVLQERNMRVHIFIVGYMFYFLCIKDFFVLTKTQAALLCVMCAVVLSLECIKAYFRQGDCHGLLCKPRNDTIDPPHALITDHKKRLPHDVTAF